MLSMLAVVKVAQSCRTCDPVDYTVHGTLQARIREWVAFSQGSNPGLPYCGQILYQLSRRRSQRILEWLAYPLARQPSRPRNRTGVSCIARLILYQLSHRRSQRILEWLAYPLARQPSRPRNRTGVSCIARRILYQLSPGKPIILKRYNSGKFYQAILQKTVF